MKRLILLLLVVLGLGALLLAERTDNGSVPAGPSKWVDLDPAQVARLEIQRSGGVRMVMVREGDAWRLTEPVDAAADRDRVNATVAVLATLLSDGVISRNPDKAGLFAVDAAGGIRVDLFYPSDDLPRATLMVGKLAAGFTHTYMTRLDGEHGDEVHRVAGPIRLQLERPVDSWRNRRVLNFQPDDVTRLALAKGHDRLELARAGDGWEIGSDRQDPPVPQDPVPAALVDHLLFLLSGLSAQSFVDGPSDLGGAPLLTVSLWQSGRDNPIDLVVEAEVPEGGYRVVADADPQRFIVPASGLAELVTDFYDVLGLKAP